MGLLKQAWMKEKVTGGLSLNQETVVAARLSFEILPTLSSANSAAAATSEAGPAGEDSPVEQKDQEVVSAMSL